MKIGKGGYGTVYRPYPVPCSKTKDLIPDQNYIGKITNKHKLPLKSIQEIQKTRAKIDPRKQFTLPFEGYCQKDASNNKLPYWETNYNIEYIYPYGGRTLSNVKPKTVVQKWILFCNLFKLFEKIAHMNKSLYHLDLKGENVLVKDSGELLLIDFDLSLSVDDFVARFKNGEYRNVVYWAWPPEVNYYLNKKDAVVDPTRVVNDLRYLINGCGFTPQQVLDNYNSFVKSNDYNDMVNKKKGDFSKVDIYSAGILMRQMGLFGFDKSVDQLIDWATNPIPSKRATWTEFLRMQKQILTNLLKKL